MTGTTEHKPQSEDEAARRGDEAQDSRLLNRIMELYTLTEGVRTRADTESFGLLLERMVYAAGAAERAELAERLAPAPDAPMRLMRRFAFDTILVARPVLQYSPRLSDKDLTILASKLGQEHLLAIAHRLSLAAAVTDILAERGDTRVLATALNNCGAAFSAAGRLRLAERARADSELQQALRLRPELVPGLLDRIKHLLTIQLPAATALPKGKTKAAAADPAYGTTPEAGKPKTPGTGEENGGVRASEADAEPHPDTPVADAGEPDLSGEAVARESGAIIPEEVVEEIAAAVAVEAGDNSPGEADGSDQDGRARRAEGDDSRPDAAQPAYASEKNLVAVARTGLIPDTVSSLAQLTRLEESIVRHCLLKAELPALLVLCKAGHLANTTFATLLKLRGATTGESIDTVAMLKRYEAMRPHTAKRIIQFAEQKKRGVTPVAAE